MSKKIRWAETTCHKHGSKDPDRHWMAPQKVVSVPDTKRERNSGCPQCRKERNKGITE